MNVLGIETSCDDTSAAVVTDGWQVRSCTVSSQDGFHQRFGGVVPEIASRAHLEVIDAICADALRQADCPLADLHAVAVTAGPGLVGSILVGLGFAKGFAYARRLPFIGVNHLEGHVAAAFLGVQQPRFPFVALVVSGGHTHLYDVSGFFTMRLLGQTVDDAAGEAFDKVAKLLQLGFPGGVAIEALAQAGQAATFDLPRPMAASGDLMMSFSGLKTAVRNLVEKAGGADHVSRADLAAAFQEAVVEVLVDKAMAALEESGRDHLVICGGVSANRRLRERASVVCRNRQIQLTLPALVYCTDNAAMIAAAGYHRLHAGERSALTLNSYATLAKAPT